MFVTNYLVSSVPFASIGIYILFINQENLDTSGGVGAVDINLESCQKQFTDHFNDLAGRHCGEVTEIFVTFMYKLLPKDIFREAEKIFRNFFVRGRMGVGMLAMNASFGFSRGSFFNHHACDGGSAWFITRSMLQISSVIFLLLLNILT